MDNFTLEASLLPSGVWGGRTIATGADGAAPSTLHQGPAAHEEVAQPPTAHQGLAADEKSCRRHDRLRWPPQMRNPAAAVAA